MTCNLCCSGWCLEWTGRGICQFGQHDNNLGSVCDAGHDFYAETLYKRLLNSDNTSSRAVKWTGAAFSSGNQVPFYFLPSFLPFPLKLLELLRFFEVLPRDPLLLPHPSLLIPPPPPPGATSLDRARLNFFTPLPTKCFTSPNKLIPWVSSTCVLNALRPICDACSERGKGHVSGVFDVDGRANQGCGFLEKTTSGRPENDQLPREVCPAFCINSLLTKRKAAVTMVPGCTIGPLRSSFTPVARLYDLSSCAFCLFTAALDPAIPLALARCPTESTSTAGFQLQERVALRCVRCVISDRRLFIQTYKGIELARYL